MSSIDDDARRWIPVPTSAPAEGGSVSFMAEGHPLLLCRAEDALYVVRDECPHVKMSMEGGTIRGTILECPFHGGQLDLRDGQPVAKPIRRPVACYPLRETPNGLLVGLPPLGGMR